ILGLIGNVFCMKMSPSANGRGLALTGLILESCVLGCFVLCLVFSWAIIASFFGLAGHVAGAAGAGGAGVGRVDPGQAQAMAGSIVGSFLMVILLVGLMLICMLTAFIIYMILLRNVARWLKERAKADQAATLLILGLSIGVGGF